MRIYPAIAMELEIAQEFAASVVSPVIATFLLSLRAADTPTAHCISAPQSKRAVATQDR